jgi:hypothetical protein
MAASTRSRPARLLLVAGLALLTGCGSCVEDPNAQGGSQGGSLAPANTRFSRTEVFEDVARPRFIVDAQAP